MGRSTSGMKPTRANSTKPARLIVFLHHHPRSDKRPTRAGIYAICQDCHYVFCRHERCVKYWSIPPTLEEGIACSGCGKEINWDM